MTDRSAGKGKTGADRRSGVRRLRSLVALLFLAAALGYGLSACNGSGEETANTNEANAVNASNSNLNTALAVAEEEGRYAEFSHQADYHSKLPCLACHTRDNNATTIGFPGKVEHSPCAGCHVEQFRNPKSQMCSICHTEPETGAMKASFRLEGFGSKFAHNRHLGVNCGTCHKPAGKTVSIPRGGSAHASCFQCHTSEASTELASCGTCHEQGAGRMKAPGRAKAFNAGFSHAAHGPRQGLNCNSCHTVYARPGRGSQLSSPATAMHFASKGRQSCATCHNGRRAFGGEDFADCKKCHQGGSFGF